METSRSPLINNYLSLMYLSLASFATEKKPKFLSLWSNWALYWAIYICIFHILQCVCRSIYRICLNLCALNFILILRIGKVFSAVELYGILVSDYFYISEIGGRTENQNSKDVMREGCVMCLCSGCSEESVSSYLLLRTKCNHGPDQCLHLASHFQQPGLASFMWWCRISKHKRIHFSNQDLSHPSLGHAC